MSQIGSIVLTGMSNLGKSHWSDPNFPDRLPSLGFVPFECDDEIAKRLDPWLKEQGYSGGIADVARWMGQPYEPQYPVNSRRYLDFEAEVMRKAVACLREATQPLVISTTGSVVYLDKEILEVLRSLATVVMLEAPEGHENKLFRKYIVEPKPVYWDDAFDLQPNEQPLAALARCYPRLLRLRKARYRKFAHIALGYHELRAPGFAALDFVDRVRTLVLE